MNGQIILDEIPKIIDLDNTIRPKSFVIFNTTKTEKVALLKSIESYLIPIYKKIKTQRNEEMNEMLKEIEWITDKYSDLYKKYNETSFSSDIIKWEDDAYSKEYEKIAARNTKLKLLTEQFSFEEIDIDEIKEKNEIFSNLNDIMNFSNLLRYNNDDEFARHYKPTEQEKEYMNLRNYLLKKEYAKYILCYNHHYKAEFDNLFNNKFKWDVLKWSIFIFEETRESFENNATEFAKTELYLNREIY